MFKFFSSFSQKKQIRNSFFALLYGFLSAIAINLFLNNAQSYSVGVTGIAQLLQAVLATFGIDLSMSILLIFFNVPLFFFCLACIWDQIHHVLTTSSGFKYRLFTSRPRSRDRQRPID